MRVRYGYESTKKQLQKAQQRREEIRERIMNDEVSKIIKRSAEASAAVDRILVGDRGHWIQSTGVINAGREQFAVFHPSGMHLTNVWGKEAAEAAVHEHIEKGTISR